MSEALKPGDFIRITAGTFERFSATVISVDNAGIVSAEIDVFGRKTPVEVHIAHVIRIPKLLAFPSRD